MRCLLFFLFLLLWQTGCTYQIVQQQSGKRRGFQYAAVGGEHSVTAYQGDTGFRPAAPDPPPSPPSTYPEYNGYPGSGRSRYPEGGYSLPPSPSQYYYNGSGPSDAGYPGGYSSTFHAEITLY